MTRKREFIRPVYKILLQRVSEPRRFIQVIAGPRQVGKTTLALQVMRKCGLPSHYASADEPTLQDRSWLNQQWDIARAKTDSQKDLHPVLLIIDEIQKITGWSETVKRLWDEDTAVGLPVRVLLLGSSPLLVQKGLTESLAGRFEVIPIIEVKSRSKLYRLPGIDAFCKTFAVKRRLLIGGQGISVKEFLSTAIEKWIA